MELLEQHGSVSIADVSQRVRMSEMTIRRDLEAMEKLGILKRIHGGATTGVSRSYEPPYAMRSKRNTEAKGRIAAAAVAMVSEGETVVLDAGTTTFAVAEHLRGRENITVCTPSLRIASLLADEPRLRLIVTGGVVRHGENSLIGDLAQVAFRELRFDLAFLSASGIAVGTGVTEWNLDDAAVKKAIVMSAKRRVALVDSSKLGREAFARVCDLDQVDVLITDGDAAARTLAAIRAEGVEVVVA